MSLTCETIEPSIKANNRRDKTRIPAKIRLFILPTFFFKPTVYKWHVTSIWEPPPSNFSTFHYQFDPRIWKDWREKDPTQFFFVHNPGTVRQLHLWRHLRFPWFIRARLHSCKLAIVNCEREVKSRQDIDKVCCWNNLEPSGCLEQPVNCIFEDIWRSHLLGADSFCELRASCPLQIVCNNLWLTRQGKTTSRYFFWTIQSCWDALEWPVNCIFEDIWRIHYLPGVNSLRSCWELATENEMSH